MKVLIICCAFCFVSCAYMYQNEVPDYEYPAGILPCKMFNSSRFDCSNRDLREIPPFPANITWLDLSWNQLRNISSNTFEGQGYLIDVNLEENNFTIIKGSPFVALRTAETLLLPNTLLEHLAPTSFKGLFNLLKLDLGSNYLTTLPEDIFVDLKELQILDIQDNNLMEIPSSSLAPLSSLQTLNLMYNWFFSLDFGEEFKNLTNLREMRVRSLELNSSRNSTSSSMGYFDRRYVVLDNDTFKYLTEIPLQRLIIIFDDVENVTVEVQTGIFEPLTNLSRLASFYNFKNALHSLQRNFVSLVIVLRPYNMKLTNASLDSIWCKTCLKHMDLSFSSIDGIYDAVFAEFPNLLTLNLTGVIYSMQHISDNAFRGLSNLEELHLANNQINTFPVKAFQAFSNGSLKILDLSYNALTGEFPDERSFYSVSTLTHLDLSHNPIETVGEWIHALVNLEKLKMNYITSILRVDFVSWTIPLHSLRNFYFSRPDLTAILDYDRFSLSEKAPGLQNVALAGTYVYELKLIVCLHDLYYLDAYKSFVHLKNFEVSWGRDIHFPNLQILKLGSNNIKTIDQMYFNTTTPRIKSLDLRYNQIQSLESASLEMLLYLTKLDLTNNLLETVNGLSNLPKISILILPLNLISEIPRAFIENLNNTTTVLDLSLNPFSCTCAIEPFRKWILADTNVYLTPHLEYTQYRCKTPEKLSGKSITEIQLDCESHLILYLSIGISSGFVASLVIILVSKYRWHIKYRMFLLCTWRRRYQPLPFDEENANVNGVNYDCFVSFAYECDKDLKWVLNELRTNMEEGPEPFRLCIGHARDFIPGTPLLEAITEAIHNSRKTIIVLSPSYLDSEWCYFETQHAWLRLLNEGQDVIILVLLEPIPDAKMTMWLRQFLCKKGYLRWPQDKGSQKLFFRCLREMIKKPTAVNRRYDS